MRFEGAHLLVRRTSPFFLSFRVGFSPRGICFSDFFSSLFSRAVIGSHNILGFSPGPRALTVQGLKSVAFVTQLSARLKPCPDTTRSGLRDYCSHSPPKVKRSPARTFAVRAGYPNTSL